MRKLDTIARGLLCLVLLVAGTAGARALVWVKGGQLLTPSTAGFNGTPNDTQRFGHAVASGDFDGDGFADVAVGAFGETVAGVALAGAVHVFYGSPAGFGLSDDQRFVQGADGVPGVAELGDGFGSVLAAGDFDGNGFDDLAIGDPDQEVGGQPRQGAFWVIYGSTAGLDPGSAIELDQSGFSSTPPPADTGLLGAALASGDFDHDGYDDLAVGWPGMTDIAHCVAPRKQGQVLVFFGSASGISTSGHGVFGGGPITVSQIDCSARFGSALAAGSFDGDAFDDLAVGAPGETALGNGAGPDAGAVYAFPGSSSGPTTVGYSLWSQAGPVAGSPESGDSFGSSLAVGNFNGDPYDDVVVGVPFESVSGVGGAGAFVLLYGAAGGLTATGSRVVTQNTPGVSNTAESADFFGSVLATGDFDHDGFDDLAAGVPAEDLGASGSQQDAGIVQVFGGSSSGLKPAGDQLVSRNSPGIPRAPASFEHFGGALAAGDVNGDGATDLVVGVEGQKNGALGSVGAIQLLLGAPAAPTPAMATAASGAVNRP